MIREDPPPSSAEDDRRPKVFDGFLQVLYHFLNEAF